MASGGITAVALATPGRIIRALLREQSAKVPTAPEKKAISKSMRLGFVRARISGVASFNGDRNVAKTAIWMVSTMLKATLRAAFFHSPQSATVKARPRKGWAPSAAKSTRRQ